PRARLGSATTARFRRRSTHGLTNSTEGAQPNQRDTARISIVACQKTGIDRLKRLTTRTTWSRTADSRRAERIPRGTPTRRATSMAPDVGSAVTAKRLQIISRTERPVRQLG